MRKRHTVEFKAKVAFESVKGLKSVNEPVTLRLTAWKKHFLETSVDTFKRGKDKLSLTRIIS